MAFKRFANYRLFFFVSELRCISHLLFVAQCMSCQKYGHRQLDVKKSIITDETEIANTLVQTVAYNSSNERHSPVFQHYFRLYLNNNERYILPVNTVSHITYTVLEGT